MKWVALVLVVILTTLQYRIWFGESSFRQIKEQRQKVTNIEQENKELVLRNQKILAEINDLRHGQDAIEERARYQLGMIKQGEVFIRILDTH